MYPWPHGIRTDCIKDETHFRTKDSSKQDYDSFHRSEKEWLLYTFLLGLLFSIQSDHFKELHQCAWTWRKTTTAWNICHGNVTFWCWYGLPKAFPSKWLSEDESAADTVGHKLSLVMLYQSMKAFELELHSKKRWRERVKMISKKRRRGPTRQSR